MKPRAWVALIAVYIVWGSTYLAIRFAIETIPPFLSAGIRFLVSGAILYFWRRLSGDPAPKRWNGVPLPLSDFSCCWVGMVGWYGRSSASPRVSLPYSSQPRHYGWY